MAPPLYFLNLVLNKVAFTNTATTYINNILSQPTLIIITTTSLALMAAFLSHALGEMVSDMWSGMKKYFRSNPPEHRRDLPGFVLGIGSDDQRKLALEEFKAFHNRNDQLRVRKIEQCKVYSDLCLGIAKLVVVLLLAGWVKRGAATYHSFFFDAHRNQTAARIPN